MATSREPHVLIVGAGLSGLLVAQALKKAGTKFTIFETEDPKKFRPKEWTMALHWGLPLMEELLPADLTARIVSDGSVDPFLDYTKPPHTGSYILDGVSGERMTDLTPEGRAIRVSRRRLRHLFMEGIDIQWQHKITDVQHDKQAGTVTATFANGASHTGTLLVGADGANSAVRKYLFRDSPPETALARPVEGMLNFSYTLSYKEPDTPKLVRGVHPVWFITLHPKFCAFVTLMEVKDETRPEDWKFFIFITWKHDDDEPAPSAENIKREFMERADSLCEPFRSIYKNIPADIVTEHQNLGYWIARPWDTENGLVTLMGDAAHAMPPYRGQGLNNATQDAYNIVKAIEKINAAGWDPEVQSKLIQEYSDEAADRGATETRTSIKNGQMMVGYDDFKNSPYYLHGLHKGSSDA